MSSLSKAFSYLIAAHVQAMGLFFVAWAGGDWLNENHPQSFNWFLLTFLVAMLGVAQTFYVIIRHALKSNDKKPVAQERDGN